MSGSPSNPAHPAEDPRDDTESAERRDGALVSEPRDPGDTRRPRREHPTAPYLEAIVSYGFRGSVRFHVPGHKGGSGTAHSRSTSARTSRASTPGPCPPPTSARRSWPLPPTAPGRRGFSPTGP